MKKLDITPSMLTHLKRVNPDVDTTKISVYEATAINTLPVSKRGSLFDGARFTESTMGEFVNYLLTGGNVPMHQIHDQSYSLPVGKVFFAEQNSNSGVAEVRILFYVDNSEDKLIAKLESSTIDEVSIGAESKHMLCSECGFDYKGSEATSENFWNQTCNEGHTIGVEGVHLMLSGLESWHETSLVSRGAARNAKIVGRAKSLLGEADYNRLAASGISPDAKILFATATANPKSPEKTMDLEKLVLQLNERSGEIALMKDAATRHATTLAELTGRATTAETALTAAKGEIDTLKTELAAIKVLPATVEADKLKKDAADARAALFSHVEKLAIASGNTKPAADATVEVLVASMADSTAKLALLPIGGAGQAANSGAGTGAAPQYAAASFQSR